MKFLLSYYLLMGFAMITIGNSQSFTNITAVQRDDGTKLVDVCYDLDGDENFSEFLVTAEISFDDGTSYQSIAMVSGDIGCAEVVEEGINRCFVWDFGNEIGDIFSTNTSILLTAESASSELETETTIRIGCQVWMKENLATTGYSGGGQLTSGGLGWETNWVNCNQFSNGCEVYYSNSNGNNLWWWGRLYNWHAVINSNNLCPGGFHVPTKADWEELIDYLGGASVAGGKMKQCTEGECPSDTSQNNWDGPNTDATNESGFTGLAGGRYTYPTFQGSHDYGYYWSSTPSDNSSYAWGVQLSYNSGAATLSDNFNRNHGYSVRCIEN